MELKECRLCPERNYGNGPVPGCGRPDAQVCLLGRNPGMQEDLLGRPFVGRAGEKLNEGLVLAGFSRNNCWVDNVTKCMTPKDVSPSRQCLEICSSTWLKDTLYRLRHLQLVVALGNQALHYFEKLGVVRELHGTFLPAPAAKVGREGVKVFVSFHPSAALRSTLMNKHFLDDFRKLHRYFESSVDA